MTQNCGSIVIIIGVARFVWGYMNQNWWSAVGLVPLFTARIRWCPLCPFGIKTAKELQGSSVASTGWPPMVDPVPQRTDHRLDRGAARRRRTAFTSVASIDECREEHPRNPTGRQTPGSRR